MHRAEQPLLFARFLTFLFQQFLSLENYPFTPQHTRFLQRNIAASELELTCWSNFSKGVYHLASALSVSIVYTLTAINRKPKGITRNSNINQREGSVWFSPKVAFRPPIPSRFLEQRFIATNTPVLLLHRNAVLHSIHALQRKHQGLSAQLSIALSLDRQVQLVRKSKSGKRQVHSLGLVQRNAHILNEVVHEEAGIEVALDQTGAEVIDAPRASSASTDSGNHLIKVQTRLVSVQKTLADTNLARDELHEIQPSWWR